MFVRRIEHVHATHVIVAYSIKCAYILNTHMYVCITISVPARSQITTVGQKQNRFQNVTPLKGGCINF